MSDVESKTDLPESASANSNEKKSSESARSDEETSSIKAILNRDAPQEEKDLQNAVSTDEPSAEMVSGIQNPEVINESPKNDEILDNLEKSSAEKDTLKKSSEEKDTLEKSSTEEDAHEKSSPDEKNLANENIIEEDSQTSESNTSEPVVKETALETEDSISGDAETEKMEIDAKALSPESPVENDVEMSENVEENPLNKEMEENLLNKQMENNPLNKETEDNPLNKETEDNPLNKEIEENTLNKEIEENTLNKEMEENTLNEKMEETPLNQKMEENSKNKEIEENSISEEKNEMEVDKDALVEKLADAEQSELTQEDASTESSACAKESEMEVEDMLTEELKHSRKIETSKENSNSEVEKNDKPDGGILTKDAKKEEFKSENDSFAIEEEKVLFIPIELDEEEDIGEYEDFTAQEVMDYLEKKINDYMLNPEINDLLRVQTESNQLREQVRARAEEISRLQGFLERLYRDQEKMLRYYGIMQKPPTRDVEVFVDMPSLELPTPLLSKNAKEQLQKKEVTITPCGTVPKTSVASPNASAGASVLKKTTSPPKKDGAYECIDLTDDADAPSNKVQMNKNPNIKTYSTNHPVQTKTNPLHPAPLPIMPNRINRFLMEPPPKPRVKISCDDKGIILQWDADINDKHEKLQCFEIFGYQEQNNQNISSALWKRIGNVKTLSLPMACTLTKFVPGNNYHFTVRGLDVHNRPGTFSDPVSTRFDPLPKTA